MGRSVGHWLVRWSDLAVRVSPSIGQDLCVVLDKNTLSSTANPSQCYHGYIKLTGTHFYTRVKEGTGTPPGLKQRTA